VLVGTLFELCAKFAEVATEAIRMPAKNPYPSAAPFVPDNPTLPKMKKAAAGCKGCDLYKRTTQTVFGEGPVHASVMFIGEQPGDQEDIQGKPFVGPAGKMLDKGLTEVGIPREEVYVTNAVKHFKWEERGKRRLHSKPNAREVGACRPWLEAEIAIVKPRIIVCLGATAAASLLGGSFRLTQHRGELIHSDWAPALFATFHPSSIFRHPDEKSRKQAYADFVSDLKTIAAEWRKLMASV
jgi:uracil-DNA glycosylase